MSKPAEPLREKVPPADVVGGRPTVVVGAGIAGLAAAYEIAQAGAPVVLLEAAARVGGKIHSDELAGAVIEGGPDSFVTNKPGALELVRELGLEGELMPTSKTNKDVFVFSRGRLRRLPDGLMLMAPTKVLPFLLSDIIPFCSKIRMGFEIFIPGKAGGDESMADFARRRFGEEALHTIISPILAGIFAGDPERLSMESTFPQFSEMERQHGSLIRSLRRMAKERRPPDGNITMFMAFRGGLNRFAEAVAARLPEGALRLGTAVEAIRKIGDGYRLNLKDQPSLAAERLILAIPADRAARLLLDFDRELSSDLASILFSSTAVVSLAYAAGDLENPPRGFGFVVDRRETLTVMAATYSSSKFPGRAPEGTVLIRCFMGGAGREGVLDCPDDQLLLHVRRDLKVVAGIMAEPVGVKIHRWSGVNPQYNVGHGDRLDRLEERLKAHPGLVLSGSSYRGVGIPDCIRSGREAARRQAKNASFSGVV